MDNLMKQIKSVPKDMRVTDRIFWDSSASIYGDIYQYLHTFGEVTSVEKLIEKAAEGSHIAKLMLQEISDQWDRIKSLPPYSLCSKNEWKKAGNSLDKEGKKQFDMAFETSKKEPYPLRSVAELMEKTNLPGVYELLIWMAERKEKAYPISA